MAKPTPGSQPALREANAGRVRRALLRRGALSQADIARSTGLSPATVSNIVRDLRARGLVEALPGDGRGRAVRVRLCPQAAVAVGVDFGHSHLRVVVGNVAHDVLAEHTQPLDTAASAEECLELAAGVVERLLAAPELRRERLVGVGLGVPGPIDRSTGTLGSPTILPGWVGVRPGERLSAALGLPVHVDNDANLGALAEVTWGVARGATDLAYIKVSSGVGAGVLLDGRLYRGHGGTAGEVGHTVLDPNGSVCRCGNRGCLETFVAVPTLVALLAGSHPGVRSLADMVSAAGAGDLGCRRVLADAGRQVGVAVASLVNLLSPGLVVLGGELAVGGELVLGPLRETVRRYAIPSAAASASVVAGLLGERAEALGALALALQQADAAGPDVFVL